MNRIGFRALVTADEHFRTPWRKTSPLRSGLALLGAALLGRGDSSGPPSHSPQAGLYRPKMTASPLLRTWFSRSQARSFWTTTAGTNVAIRRVGQPSHGISQFDHINDRVFLLPQRRTSLGLTHSHTESRADTGVATATVTINVEPRNDRPRARNDAIATAGGTPQSRSQRKICY